MTPFDTFWSAYPRRIAKLDALKAWAKAIKISPPAEIIAGAIRFAALGKEIQFTPYPATWLRAGQWMDEEAGHAKTFKTASEWLGHVADQLGDDNGPRRNGKASADHFDAAGGLPTDAGQQPGNGRQRLPYRH